MRRRILAAAFYKIVTTGMQRETKALPLRAVPQHRQEVQTDEMRDALLIPWGLFALELTAQHAGRCQLRRVLGLDYRGTPGKRHFSK